MTGHRAAINTALNTFKTSSGRHSPCCPPSPLLLAALKVSSAHTAIQTQRSGLERGSHFTGGSHWDPRHIIPRTPWQRVAAHTHPVGERSSAIVRLPPLKSSSLLPAAAPAFPPSAHPPGTPSTMRTARTALLLMACVAGAQVATAGGAGGYMFTPKTSEQRAYG